MTTVHTSNVQQSQKEQSLRGFGVNVLSVNVPRQVLKVTPKSLADATCFIGLSRINMGGMSWIYMGGMSSFLQEKQTNSSRSCHH